MPVALLEVVLEEVVYDREFIEPKVRVFVDRAVDFLMRRFSGAAPR